MINYIIYTILCLGCSFLIYHFFLKGQKTFHFNRFFLIATLILSLLAPLIEIDVLEVMPRITEFSFEPATGTAVSHDFEDGITVSEFQKPQYPLTNSLWYLYLILSLGFLLRFFKNLLGIIKLIKHRYGRIGNLILIETKNCNSTSSFFNYLFINSERLKDRSNTELIIQHELVHCKHYHTLDIIFIELLVCVFWFNPFIWLYRRAVVQNHEFIADAYTVQSGIDIEYYSQVIINSGHMEHRVPLTSGFNFIQIKNRIIMLHQSKSSLLKRTLKITTALLLFTGIFMLSSYKNLSEPLIVVIDAGHGGHDPGFLNEKDIVFNISKQLSNLSDETIKIITIRDDDEFVSLQDRVDFTNAQNPDLVISLHCNSHKNESVNGVEAFYSTKNKQEGQSLNFSEILVKNQLHLFSEKGKVKQADFFVLKNVNCPAILLQLGFLSNKKEQAILSESQYQKEIAKSIYASLVEIRNSK